MGLSTPLLIVAVVIPVLLVATNVVVFAKYVDPEHASGHALGTLAVLVGGLVAECCVLLLAFDVVNQSGTVGCGSWNNDCGGFDMASLWEAMNLLIIVLVVGVFPFLMFAYELDGDTTTASRFKAPLPPREETSSAEPSSAGKAPSSLRAPRQKCCWRASSMALCYEVVMLVVVIPILYVMWTFMGVAWIPVSGTYVNVTGPGAVSSGPGAIRHFQGFTNVTLVVTRAEECGGVGTCVFSADTLEITVTIVVYAVALLSFVGWFLFVLYGGIGLISLPLDLFNAFRFRPKVMTKMEEANFRSALRAKAEVLIATGERIGEEMIESKGAKRGIFDRRRRRAAERRELNQYRVQIEALEDEFEQFETCRSENYREQFNPLVPYVKLVCAVLATGLTIAWILHIFLYMTFTPYISPFLNTLLETLDGVFPLFGAIALGVLSLYLLFAVVKGNFKFGSRFFLVTIHPMELHRTLINTFLYNVSLVLMCVLPVVQFSTEAFASYAHETFAGVLFGSVAKHLRFFRYFWEFNAFIFVLLAVMLATAIYLAVCPSDRDEVQNAMGKIRQQARARQQDAVNRIARHGGAVLELPSISQPRKG